MAKPATKRKTTNSPRSRKGGLSQGERLFAREYLVDFNGTQAAIRAGYSGKTAYSQANRLLKRVEVRKEIAKAAAKSEEKVEVSAEKTLDELARIAFADVRKAVKWSSAGVKITDSDKLDDATAAAISEVKETKDGEIVVKFHSKPQALALLARHHGLLIDRHEVTIRHEIESLTDEQLERLEHQLTDRARSKALESQTIDGKAEEVGG